MSIYCTRQIVEESRHIKAMATLSQFIKESVFQSNILVPGGRSHEGNLTSWTHKEDVMSVGKKLYSQAEEIA
jgi:hypothetical protein